jgi:hypothetical protein
MTRLNTYGLYAVVGVVLLCTIIVTVLARKHTAGPPGVSTTRIFRLQEVSAFDLTQQAREFGEGQRASYSDKPDPNVLAYPRFGSQQPIYGKVSFADPLIKPDPRTTYHFALDESGGTGQGYDRLYFDLNQDGDLTNDKVRAAQKNPPKGATLRYSDPTPQICFETLTIPLPFGTAGERPLPVMPRLLISGPGYKTISFITTKARKGRIRIGGGKYDILLGHNYITAGWFDHPWTALHLIPAGNKSRLTWRGGDQLVALHKIDGTFWQFSATPAGDKLTVRPYAGPVGSFEVGAGSRKVEVVDVQGSLRSRTTTVAVGEVGYDSQRAPFISPVQTCQLPVGDYLPEGLSVRLGTLCLNLSNNYHTDGKRMDVRGRSWVYGVHIREDQPFVLDFSNQPAVLFASPVAHPRVKPGEEIKVLAVLTDPVLDLMICRLHDTAGRRRATTPDGQLTTSNVDVSLDPNVVIRRAGGEIVAEGVMPFGSDGTCGYSWRVPEDLRLSGSEETLTITATYDTQELYGKVAGSRQVTVYRE